MNLDFNKESRKKLFSDTQNLLENYYSKTKERRVSTDWDLGKIRENAKALNLDKANEIDVVLNHVIEGLTKYAVHTPHQNYFGLFNPRPNFSSTIADLITATFNPQLAAWSHAPFANEIESYILQEFGKKIGYIDSIDGTFCTGGAEANLTAIICALNNAFPDFSKKGLFGIGKQPIIYCSSESHHSIEKAAKVTGLGSQSVSSIPVNVNLEMDLKALNQQIVTDKQNGLFPLMIVGTAGTTGAGSIDDLRALHTIAVEDNIWFHVDAAYGGAIAISEKYKTVIAGIELSDSVTIDLHKWFSIPMGASIFLTKNKTILHKSFSVKTDYMPEDGDATLIVDPYIHSIQWSRRFIGLKMYLPLAIHGWEGYEQTINKQVEIGLKLKSMLQEKGWIIKNNSILPIICFTRESYHSKEMTAIVDKINTSGKAWVSSYPIHGIDTCRVCITNYATGDLELNELINILDDYKI